MSNQTGNIGKIIYDSYCNGWAPDYNAQGGVIENEGDNWALVVSVTGQPILMEFQNGEVKQSYLDEWIRIKDGEE